MNGGSVVPICEINTIVAGIYSLGRRLNTASTTIFNLVLRKNKIAFHPLHLLIFVTLR